MHSGIVFSWFISHLIVISSRCTRKVYTSYVVRIQGCLFAHGQTMFWLMAQVILSDAIVQLSPRFFWLGGGEVDLKLGTKTDEFIKIVKPFITDCTY